MNAFELADLLDDPAGVDPFLSKPGHQQFNYLSGDLEVQHLDDAVHEVHNLIALVGFLKNAHRSVYHIQKFHDLFL